MRKAVLSVVVLVAVLATGCQPGGKDEGAQAAGELTVTYLDSSSQTQEFTLDVVEATCESDGTRTLVSGQGSSEGQSLFLLVGADGTWSVVVGPEESSGLYFGAAGSDATADGVTSGEGAVTFDGVLASFGKADANGTGVEIDGEATLAGSIACG